MKIEIVIIPEAGPTPAVAQQTYALGLQLAPFTDAIDVGGLEPIILQRGYASPKHALAALIDCLTFAPPDMTTYEEGLAHVAGLLDRVTDVEGAITSLGGRLNTAEEQLEGMTAPAAQPGSRLLPPRMGNRAAATTTEAPPPPIRRPAQRTVMSVGHGAGGRIKGGAALEITGGVGRPGDLGPTGVGADQGEDE